MTKSDSGTISLPVNIVKPVLYVDSEIKYYEEHSEIWSIWDKYKKIYIAGPMTGYIGFNKEAFMDTENWLARKETNCLIFNPGRHLATDNNLSYEEVMAIDIVTVCHCDAICLMENWHTSKGAQKEEAVADILKKEVIRAYV